MKPSKLRTAGILLLLCSTLVGVGIQVFGPGLFTTRSSTSTPVTTSAQQGVNITITAESSAAFPLKRILPLVAMDVLGVLCIILSSRRGNEVGP
jgi:4-amino-4-deoxy-L-arabinose transferase-like glycosyltransferase